MDKALERLQALVPEAEIRIAHGQMPERDLEAVMRDFYHQRFNVLLCSTIIETGIDIPRANTIVIERADKFGLAQLHQLRGRIGRGAAQSLCILMFQQPLSELARARLKIVYESNDGFAIAQQDLQLRGPGELLGARQSGVAMLRFADISADEDLLELARQTADELLRDSPETARAHLHRWMANKHDYLHV